MTKSDKQYLVFQSFIFIVGSLSFLTKGFIQWISFGIICMIALLILVSFFVDKT